MPSLAWLRVSAQRGVLISVQCTSGSSGASVMMACEPNNKSVSSVCATPNTLRRLTRPKARSSAEVSGKRLLLWPSITAKPVMAPPPSVVSAITADLSSLISCVSIGIC